MSRLSSFLSLPPCSALASLSMERAALSSTVLELSRRRDEFLLSDASDAIIREIDTETDRLHLAMERLDAVEREVLRRGEQPAGSAVPHAFAAAGSCT